MDYLSVISVYKNENQWLEEWILYHQLVGVERFYLFCNEINCQDSLNILKPWIDKGIVKWFHDTSESPQNNILNHNIPLLNKKTFWIASIDIDEFIIPIKTYKILETLETMEKHSGILINWKVFGNSNYCYNPFSQINSFIYRAKNNHILSKSVKTICRPHMIARVTNPHCFEYKTMFPVNTNEMTIQSYIRGAEPLYDKLCINHYITRNTNWFFKIKNTRGSADIKTIEPKGNKYFEYHNRNELLDIFAKNKYGLTVATMLKKTKNIIPLL